MICKGSKVRDLFKRRLITLSSLALIGMAGVSVALFSSRVWGLPVSGSAQPSKTLQERLGYSADAKLLIVHADDLAVAHSVNAASTKALETGSVSSASIMVPCPWLTEIAVY